jgi:hypothetical protein
MSVVSPSEQLDFDRDFAEQRRQFLKEACRLSLGLGYDDPRRLIQAHDGGRLDADAIPGLDDVAMHLAACYPEWLGSDPIEAEYKLFDMLLAEYGNKVRTPESRSAAARKAWVTIRRRRSEKAARP